MLNHIIQTIIHKVWVCLYILQFILKLLWRALVHDLSKLSKHEAPYFAKVLPQLKSTTYGSEAYKACLRSIAPAIKHHHEVNRHHPGYHEEGIKGFNLIDLVEMWCDWRAAVRRHNDGDIRKSIEKNKDLYSHDVAEILRNSV